MLVLDVKVTEYYDDSQEVFVPVTMPIAFEHSLLSLSKWESKYEKPFLSENHDKTEEEILDYLRMMAINPAVTDAHLANLSNKNITELQNYLGSKQTATWFSDRKKTQKAPPETPTAELIYYWMFSYQIPIECESWHINRLLTLIRVFGEKNQEPEKMSKSEMLARNRKLNAQRKAKMQTKG